MISFYINLSDLDCWLTLAPLKSMIEETGTEVHFRPMMASLGNVVTKVKPGEDDPLAVYKARRARARQLASGREAERVCEMLDLEQEQGRRQFDPVYLSLGLMYALEAGFEPFDYAEQAFQKSFRQAGDVASPGGVEDLLRALGVPAANWPDFVSANRVALEASSKALLEEGILSAPAFVVDGEIFHGREHLPLITWMLKGRKGIAPV